MAKTGISRFISTDFWTDRKVMEIFTADDRYLFLYILTNKETTMCGVYELSRRKAAFETGLSSEAVNESLDHLSGSGVIDLDDETGEVLITNWYKYNGSNKASDNRMQRIRKELSEIKSDRFRKKISDYLNGIAEDEKVELHPDAEKVARVAVEHLNKVCGTNYPVTSNTVKLISDILNNGHSVSDIGTVINKKANDWLPKYSHKEGGFEKYMRPDTLFGIRFDEYLYQPGLSEKLNARY